MDPEDLIRRAFQTAITERLREKLRPPRPEPEMDLPPLRNLFPADFPLDAVEKKYGVEVKMGRGGIFRLSPGLPACFDPGTKTITFNVDALHRREAISEEIKKRCYVSVPPEHVYVWILLHECGHAARQAHIPTRNGLLSPLSLLEKVETWEEEREVDKFAEANYYRWKWTRDR